VHALLPARYLPAALVLMLLPGLAYAKSVEDDIAAAAVEIERIVTNGKELEAKVAPGRGFITEDEAIQRFQDHVYLHMIGEHELAAEGFYALVTTAALADAGLHRDAEWYLAETLFKMKNYVHAEARFQQIVEDEAHPFRDDGVRRLLELYAATANGVNFNIYYEKEIVRGRVKPSDLITYSVAKSFYRQDDLVQAKSHLLEIGDDSTYFNKARYFLGAIMVREGELEAAAQYFTEVSQRSVNTLEDRQILDLSLLALGRLYYEMGDFAKASEFYGEVGGDSEYLADKLYEIVWSFIKQSELTEELLTAAKNRDGDSRDTVNKGLGHTQQAVRGVEIFLLAFPEHEFTAQLKLLQGHLHVQEARYDAALSPYGELSPAYDAALSAYEQVIEDYTPVKEYFAELANSQDLGREYFRGVLTGDDSGASGLADMPAYARAMMMADDDLSLAMDVYRELARQDRDIQTSERLVDELSAILQTSTSIGGFEQIRYDSLLNRSLAVDKQLQLLELEQLWLVEGSGDRSMAQQLDQNRKALTDRTRDAQQVLDEAKNALSSYDDEVRRAQYELTELLDKSRGLKTEGDQLRAELSTGELSETQAARVQEEVNRVRAEMTDIDEQIVARRGQNRRRDFEAQVDSAEKDLDRQMREGVRELRGSYRSFRSKVQDASLGGRFDELHRTIDDATDRLDGVAQRLKAMESSELARIKARFQHETQEVASQRVELQRALADAEKLSIALTRTGFGRLEDFFGDSVLKADMGIVDVYWAQKLEVADEKDRLKDDRNELLADLEARFALIKQKLRN
jgi:hypothetical protein